MALRERSLALAIRFVLMAALVGLLLLRARLASGETWVVSPSGDDSGPGTVERPFRSFARAAEAAAAGDVVSFRAGTYATEEEVVLTRSGSSGSPITFAAWPGEKPVLDGGGTPGGIVTLGAGASWIRLSGFTVRGYRIWGLYLEGGNRGVVLDHLDVSGGEACLRVTDGNSGDPPAHGGVEDLLVEDSTFRDALGTVVDCTPGPCDRTTFRRLDVSGGGLVQGVSFGADGIGLEKGREVVVEDCVVHDNGGDGIDLNSRDTAGNVAGVVVRRNRVERNRLMGVKLWAGGRMENNVVTGQGITPVMLGRFPGTYVVVNNTVAFNMQDAWAERDYALGAAWPWDDGTQPAISLTLANNIFAFNGGPATDGPTGIYLGPKVTLVERNDLYFSREENEVYAEFVSGRSPEFSRVEILDGTFRAATGQGEGDRGADPLFASAWPSTDLRLRAGSPAIDAGDASLAPPHDLGKTARDARPDIGAWEASSTASEPFGSVVPAAAHAPGALGSLWRTDVALVNASGGAASLTATYLPSGGGAPRTFRGTLDAGTRLFPDVLVTLFGVDAAARSSGAIRVSSDRRLVVSSRTWNAAESGTYGAHLGGVDERRAVTPGRPGILPQLSSGAATRTNVGLTNLGGAAAVAVVRLLDADGRALGHETVVEVPAGTLVQVDDVFRACGAGAAAVARGEVEVRTAGGKVFAYASVIDNATSDPTIVPVIVP